MSGDGSIGYWSHDTSHYSYHRFNDGCGISEDEGLEVSLGNERRGRRSLETSHSSTSNHRGRGHMYFDTIHSSYCNRGGYYIIFPAQDIHFSTCALI